MKHLSVNPRHASLCSNPININDYQYLINKVAGYLVSTHPSVDARELYTIGYLALAEAGERYDPERNAKFSTFAYNYLKYKMLDEIKYLTQTVRVPQRYADKVSITSYEYSDYEPYSMEAYYDEEEQEWLREATAKSKKALDLLTSKERLVVDCRIGKCGETKTYAEISSILNCSIQNAQQEYQRGIKKMRRFVESGAMAA